MSHCARISFFSDLSLRWPVPGEKEGDGDVGRNKERVRDAGSEEGGRARERESRTF